MKYLLPWENVSDQVGYPYFIRRVIADWNIKKDLSDWRNHPYVGQGSSGEWRHCSFINVYSSKEEAMASMDKSMIDNGWVAISKERAEKLKLLL